MFYSSTIFETTGVNPNLGTALVGVANFLATIVSSILLVRLGRRTLLWVFSLVMAVALVPLGILYVYGNPDQIGILEIILVMIFVVGFGCSWGPVTWIILPEIMTEKSMSIGSLFNQIFLIIMALFTESLLKVLSGWLFIIFAGFCILAGFFTFFIVKETKGKTEAEVANLYVKDVD